MPTTQQQMLRMPFCNCPSSNRHVPIDHCLRKATILAHSNLESAFPTSKLQLSKLFKMLWGWFSRGSNQTPEVSAAETAAEVTSNDEARAIAASMPSHQALFDQALIPSSFHHKRCRLY
jgi:hypothetical protein